MSDTIVTTRPLTLQDLCDGLLKRPEPSGSEPSFIDQLLHEQQQLSAVEQFARTHSHGAIPDQAKYYSKLLPASPPAAGEQYAFEVDLDRCSGCKACVTACHALNGLDDRETWRDVGLLIGGTESVPVMQHVTAACHHCLEPACMIACPVNAYEKSPLTGIVRHLDDQCFGCQYCTLACPYDVPKYNAAKGIVRKCDMCASRLSKSEAPACVQACPHEAIAIRIVEVARVIENAEADNFLPAAPEPHFTLPTTTYKTNRVFPRNMLPADYYSINPQHAHWPLVVMLVLTQLSVGAFATGCILETSIDPQLSIKMRPFQATSALILGLLALAASTFHLGRPLYAFRGILGLRHSWLSREILAFGLFAGLAVPYAGICWFASMPNLDSWKQAKMVVDALPSLGFGVSMAGTIGVFCSVMIYVFTKRDLWSFERTLLRFTLTTVVLGIATTWLSLMIMGLFVESQTSRQISSVLAGPLAKSLVVASMLKLVYDAGLLLQLTNVRNTPLKRSALLIIGPLRRIALIRLSAGTVGGILIPLFVLMGKASVVDGNAGMVGGVCIVLVWIGCLVGELMERYLFFAAVSAARMPGGVRP